MNNKDTVICDKCKKPLKKDMKALIHHILFFHKDKEAEMQISKIAAVMGVKPSEVHNFLTLREIKK